MTAPAYRPPAPLAIRFFDGYFRRQFARYFTTVRWQSLADPASWDPAVPTLGVANHTNWWDGFLAFLLTRELGRAAHLLMEAEHLARYRAFRYVGTLPMHRGRPRAAYRDLMHARVALRPETVLWIFPQGARRPAGEPIAGCERGAAQLIRAAGGPVRLLPVAFRYPFLGEQLPEAFALVGEPLVLHPGEHAARRAVMAIVETELRRTVERLDAALAGEEVARFRVLVDGKLSVNKRMDRFRHRVGLLRGEYEPRNG